MPRADQVSTRSGVTAHPTTRATLRYSMSPGVLSSTTSINLGASKCQSPESGVVHARASYSIAKQPPVPLFNPSELQFFKHFLTSDDGESSVPSYKPKLLSSYKLWTNSLATVSPTASTYSNPAGDPYTQPYMMNGIQPDSYSSALYNMPLTFAPAEDSYGTNSMKNTNSVPSAITATNPVVQTNSFMRPQSEKLNATNAGYTGHQILTSESNTSVSSLSHVPIVVESKPVSVSDQERDEESKRLQNRKPSGSYPSLPRPPTANSNVKDRTTTSNLNKMEGQNRIIVRTRRTDASSSLVSYQRGYQTSDSSSQKLADEQTTKAANTSTVKLYKSSSTHGCIHKSVKLTKAPILPNPPAVTGVTGTALHGFKVSMGNVEESRPPRGNKARRPASPLSLKHKTSEHSSGSSSSIGSRSSGRMSPSMYVICAKSSTDLSGTNGFTPLDTNPLLGTFLGHQKVKNLNYTPAKPYKDLINEINADQNDMAEAKLLIRPKTPTMFYRKGSKPEAMLHGAPERTEGLKKIGALDMGKECDGYEADEEIVRSECKEAQENDDDGDDDDEDDDASNDDQADFDDDEDDDDDGIDAIDEDDDDGGSSEDGRSLASSRSRSQQNLLRIRSATKRLLGLSLSRTASQTSTRSRPSSSTYPRTSSSHSLASEYQPALTPSLFCNIPPTVNFVTDGLKVEQLPWEIRKLLKWRMSPITPNVVKNCIFRSHFRVTKKNHDWIGYWGKHMKSHVFKSVQEYQKVNHFPGSFQIGRKDRLWRNLSRYQILHGKQEFNFFPQTFVLPMDMKLLKRAWEEGGSKQKWILKPPASARGIGIRLISKLAQVPKKHAVIVQRYLSRPYLINDSKFDMRVYVYVTSYDPLRIYVYEDGLARFASVKYSHCMKSISNKYMHLTNYSINKKNQDYQSNSDENACQGHKWTMKTLWQYMRRRGVDTRKVWESMLDLIVKTIITSESCVNSLVKANVHRRYSCHELFGFDIMLDETLKPWIIEVNISPSLHSNSSLDKAVKGGMISDLLNISGFTIPDKDDVQLHTSAKTSDTDISYKNICIDPRLYPSQLSPDERAKHAYYCQRFKDEAVAATVLNVLTPDDIRFLTETINEDCRKGDFVRVFPSPTSHKYHRFFEQPRYYNLLLDQWINRYGCMESEGIYMLDNFCKKGIHLENPTTDRHHQWLQPLSNDLRAVSAPGPPKFGASSSLPSLRKKRLGLRSWHGPAVPAANRKKKKKVKGKSTKQGDDEQEAEDESEEN